MTFKATFLLPLTIKRFTQTRLNAIKLVQISFKTGFIVQNGLEDKHAGFERQQNAVMNCTVCSGKIQMLKTPMCCYDNIWNKTRVTTLMV